MFLDWAIRNVRATSWLAAILAIEMCTQTNARVSSSNGTPPPNHHRTTAAVTAITPACQVIWVDRNHDGVSQTSEIAPMHAYGVIAIQLTFVIYNELEPNGNRRQLRSTYTVRRRWTDPIDLAIEDVFFRVYR